MKIILEYEVESFWASEEELNAMSDSEISNSRDQLRAPVMGVSGNLYHTEAQRK